jgi:ureidoglycolate lyase
MSGAPNRLSTEPIDAVSFAPFGRLVSCDRSDVGATSANLGSADRRDFVADVQNLRPAARLNLATFRCRPWTARPLVLTLLEKHPASTQVFVPMTKGAYLVVVAHGEDAPELSSVRAFRVDAATGIAYAPGVWHHPMIALDGTIDFSCLVWEDGTALDCVTHHLTRALTIDV